MPFAVSLVPPECLWGSSSHSRGRKPSKNNCVRACDHCHNFWGKTGGTYDVEGIGIGGRSPAADQSMYKDQAREIARQLAKEEGIFTGISPGLNVTAAHKISQELRPGHTVVTVAVDTRLKYLASNLFKQLNCQENRLERLC